MAQGLIASSLPQAQVHSAGLGAMLGMPADATAIRLMKDRSIDIALHRARQVSLNMCLDADVVLVMDSDQRRRLESIYPQVRGRVFKLGEYTNQDIPDPYQRGESAFREALAKIDESVAEWLKRIRKL
jgi:protein-tyrosine phosphatase